MLPIVTAPNNVLSQVAKKVGKIDRQVLDFIEEMKQSLASAKDPEGVGLASPQVGKSLRIFIIKQSPKAKVSIFINPKIIEKSQELVPLSRPKKSKNKKAGKLEGCLSLPNIWGPVLRAPSVKLQYLDETGRQHVKMFKGVFATIIQHEYDHI
ncbi:MAG TPA: peptide deformylase, partial [Candidatus Saccharimonadales bacterium]|nr:peptide deformylase [Candidatus Saccharimonadales bacterium]